MGRRLLRIGVSACYFHADPERAIFKGKTLLYLEQSMAQYVMRAGALPVMLPPPCHSFSADSLLSEVDGLLLQGGSDVSPRSYGEEPLRPEWAGDYVRDQYEIDLIHAAVEQVKPVLGICRGAQILNVALGGSLYQDVTTQVPGSLVHRDWHRYDDNAHAVAIVPGMRLADVYGSLQEGCINTVHHQAIKEVAPCLRVEAYSPEDNIVEAVSMCPQEDMPNYDDFGPYVVGVQWHPEFMAGVGGSMLQPDPLIEEFLKAARSCSTNSGIG